MVVPRKRSLLARVGERSRTTQMINLSDMQASLSYPFSNLPQTVRIPCALSRAYFRVIDMVYAQLPRAYNDLYPRLPPTREQPAPRKARKSWHRLHLTMSWVRYLQRYTGGKDTTSAALGRARLTLERKSRAIISLYGVNTLFPEQVYSAGHCC